MSTIYDMEEYVEDLMEEYLPESEGYIPGDGNLEDYIT